MFRKVDVFVWTVALLALGELGLEYRAHRRGWETILLGRAAASADSPVAAPASKIPTLYGPSQDFPFRSLIVQRRCEPGTLRLWVASASHAEDIYLSPDAIFPNQAGLRLQKSGAHWQILNASRAGNTIRVNAEELAERGPDWRPTVVVLYQMSMDVVDLSRRFLSEASLAVESEATTESIDFAQPQPAKREANLIRRVASQSTIYTSLKANITPILAEQRVLHDELGEGGERAFRSRLRGFIDAVRKLGATPILCTFATSHGSDSSDRLPGEVRHFMLRYNMYLSPAGWTHTIRRLNDVLREVADEQNVTLIDCERTMTGRPQYFRDYVHFSPEGHAQLGEMLADRLQQVGVGPFTASNRQEARP